MDRAGRRRKLREAQDAIKHLKVESHAKEVSLKSTHTQIAKYEKQKETAADKKQFDAFNHEIETARQKARTLEDQILEGMSEAEERTAKLPEHEGFPALILHGTRDDRIQLYCSKIAGSRSRETGASGIPGFFRFRLVTASAWPPAGFFSSLVCSVRMLRSLSSTSAGTSSRVT